MKYQSVISAVLLAINAVASADDTQQEMPDRGGWAWGLLQTVEEHMPDKVTEVGKQITDKVVEELETGQLVGEVKKNVTDKFMGLIQDYLPEDLASLIHELSPEETDELAKQDRQNKPYAPKNDDDAHNYIIKQCMVGAKQIRMFYKKKPGGSEVRRMADLLLSSACIGHGRGVYPVEGGYVVCLVPIYRSCFRMMVHLRHPETTELTQDEKDALSMARDILSSIVKKENSNAQKARAIHDWMVRNCSYDYESYKKKKPVCTDRQNYLHYDGKYMILDRRGVCESYAQAYWLLLQMSGVPCCIVHGNVGGTPAGAHAWNLVYMNGQWVHVDVTHDDVTPDDAPTLCYDYYSKTDKDLIKNRTWNKRVLSSEQKSELCRSAEDFVKLSLKKQKRSQQEYSLILSEPMELESFEKQLRETLAAEKLEGSFRCRVNPFYFDGLIVKYNTKPSTKKK